MDQDTLKSISKEVYRRFPEVKGKKPKIQLLKPSNKRTVHQAKTYLLVYSSQVKIDDQLTLPRLVRVIVTGDGQIVKITTSK